MTDLERFRAQKDEFYRRSPQSPLPESHRASFSGLDYFAENQALRFIVEPEPADGAEITIQTSDGRERVYTREATATIEVDGEPATVTIYGTPHGYFLPFRDATSGAESYGAGRFLDIDEPLEDRITIDFNLAYNPYCAYDEGYSCPLPPAENWLRIPIRAGERTYRPS
jgi:uncharacterized protein (DUF1684 family)